MSQLVIDRPEEFLTEPSDALDNVGSWVIVARNRRVNRDWERLIDRSPDSAVRWYKYLRKNPTTRYPGRVFPLRGSVYCGAWECEVTGGDRVYYIPDELTQKVVVYYAGPHIKPVPRP